MRFRTPGTYTCKVSSADITTALLDEKFRPALLVKSNPIVLTIVKDPAWVHAAAISYGDAYEKLCRGADVPEQDSPHCFELAQRITYLDTADSLAIEVKWLDGRNHGWENGFWEAIQHSSQPEEALHLMAARIQDPGFQASNWIVEWLAGSDLKLEVPEAFQSHAPATYHAQAVETLRKYVRLLGSSLSRKDPAVLSENLKTYRIFAEQKYCGERSLIPADEQDRLLAGLQ